MAYMNLELGDGAKNTLRLTPSPDVSDFNYS